jgi:hypothetical protein
MHFPRLIGYEVVSGKKRTCVYEHPSLEWVAENVIHIYGLYRNAVIGNESSETQRARLCFLRSLINNLRHEQSQLSPRLLAELSRYIPLTIGGAFKLLGYELDRMGRIDFLLNGDRTRIIESYPFHRDREVDLPYELSETDVPRRNAFVSEFAPRWQTGVRIRTIEGPAWQRNGMFYTQIGVEDNLALSGLPPGSFVSVEPVSREEQLYPNPKAAYLLQFGNGYRCCSCTVSRGKLILLPRSGRYRGPYEFLYPQEVRIVGRARGFSVRLPPARPIAREVRPSRLSAPLVLPWEQPSLSALFRAKRLRFGLTEQALDSASELLQTELGTHLSRRTLRRYERETGVTPHTSTMLALTLFHAARISDVLQLLGMWHADSDRHSLETWRNAQTLKDLPLVYPTATTPMPTGQWNAFLGEWGEWPTLLSMATPRLQTMQHRILRIHQADLFNGLDPLIHTNALALLEETDRIPDVQSDAENKNWERPIYAIQHGQDIFCGCLVSDGQRVALMPHPRSSARRLSFLRNHVTIIGRFIALASPFRQNH